MSPRPAWYFHLPACATAFEVDTLADESLSLLVEAHEEAGVPALVAVTGSLLGLLRERRGACLDRLARAARAGTVEIAATTCHEVCPPLLPAAYLRRQIETGLALVRDLLGVRPTCFWPGNLAWTPLLARLLPASGCAACLVDEAHLREARQTQLWEWLGEEPMRMASVLVDAAAADAAACRWRLGSPAGTLELHAVPAAARQALTFGNRGAIHDAWNDARLDAVAARLLAPHAATGPLLCADDGDRVNPVSIHQYRRLLGHLAAHAGKAAAPTVLAVGETLDFLPAWLPGEAGFWSDTAATDYLRLLDDLYREADAGRVEPDRILPLQDVFPLFWKRSARVRWFHERAWELLGTAPARARAARRS